MSEEFDIPELMAVVLSRYIKDGDVMFQGAATPLPMVAIELAKARGVDITYFSAFGINPSEPINFEKLLTQGFKYANNIKSTAELHALPMWEQWSKGKLSLEFLRPAQIDEYFNCNNTVVYDAENKDYNKPKVRLPGGMAVSDAINLMERTILYTTRHIKRNLVKKVDFLMCKGYPQSDWRKKNKMGTGCAAFVTDLCVFEPDPETSKMKIKSIHPGITVEKVIESTGWKIENKDYPITPAPNAKELKLLREQIDPLGYREMDFPHLRNNVMVRVANKGVNFT